MIKIFTIYLFISMTFFQCNPSNQNSNINSSDHVSKNQLLGIWKGKERAENIPAPMFLNFKDQDELELLDCMEPEKGIQKLSYQFYQEKDKPVVKLGNIEMSLYPTIYENSLSFSLPPIPPDGRITTNISLYRFEKVNNMCCEEKK